MALQTTGKVEFQEHLPDNGRGALALSEQFVNRDRAGTEPSQNLAAGFVDIFLCCKINRLVDSAEGLLDLDRVVPQPGQDFQNLLRVLN